MLDKITKTFTAQIIEIIFYMITVRAQLNLPSKTDTALKA